MAYFFAVFPAVFLLIAYALDKLYLFIKKYQKILAAILIIVLIICFTFVQMKSGVNLINSKKDSYLQVKLAGEWLNENTAQDSKVITASSPHIYYYSKREVIHLAGKMTEEDFNKILEQKNIHAIQILEKICYSLGFMIII